MSASASAALLAAASQTPIDVPALTAALASSADPNTRDGTNRTPLLLASLADDVPAAIALLRAGADPNALDDMRQSPWLVTGVTGSVAMLEAMLPFRPDMTLRNRYGGVSVIPASERGHVEYVRRVVDTEMDVNHVNHLGWTALLEAVILGDGGERHTEIVRILLGAGADPGIRDKDGVSALKHARDRGYAEMVRVLEGAGAPE